MINLKIVDEVPIAAALVDEVGEVLGIDTGNLNSDTKFDEAVQSILDYLDKNGLQIGKVNNGRSG